MTLRREVDLTKIGSNHSVFADQQTWYCLDSLWLRAAKPTTKQLFHSLLRHHSLLPPPPPPPLLIHQYLLLHNALIHCTVMLLLVFYTKTPSRDFDELHRISLDVGEAKMEAMPCDTDSESRLKWYNVVGEGTKERGRRKKEADSMREVGKIKLTEQ